MKMSRLAATPMGSRGTTPGMKRLEPLCSAQLKISGSATPAMAEAPIPRLRGTSILIPIGKPARYNQFPFPLKALVTSSEQNSERLTRKRLIDPKLKAAGWKIVPFLPGMSLNPHQNCAITEFETANGPADYALCADGTILVLRTARRPHSGCEVCLRNHDRYSTSGNIASLFFFCLTAK